MIFKSINPFSLETIAEYPEMSASELNKTLHLAERAYKSWRQTTFEHRQTLMLRVAALLRRDAEQHARLISTEMGKIVVESQAEVEKSAAHAAYFAEHTEGMLRDQVFNVSTARSVVAFDPIGCIFAIMPWNFPFWQVFRYAAPTIMAGNVTILKHAPNVFGCAKAIENIFREAGFPEGIFQSVVVDTPSVESIIAHDVVQGVTLTGSEYAGSAVAALAGKHVKKTVLELGGSDPFIVLADADLDKAARVAAQSRMMNAGQACICAKRFIVLDAVKDAFLEKLEHNIAQMRQGDPFDPSVQLGPMARVDLAEKLAHQVNSSLRMGAVRRVGGAHDNCHFKPTLLAQVTAEMPVFAQETFGPVASVIGVSDENAAIALANNHRYGLAAAIWTRDVERAYRLARQIDAGNVFVNALVRSDSRLPFGGVKKSGYGREMSEIGLKEFVNWKTIVVESA